jgi:hypothetical protein
MRHSLLRLAALAPIAAATPALAQSLPASPASSTEKPGKEETAPPKDDTGLIISASSRVRYETVDGRPRPMFATAEDSWEIRTGVAVEYGPGPLAIGGELIDSRAYSNSLDSQIGKDDVNALELPQAYFKLRLDHNYGPVGKLSVEGGRFLINFGASRLIGTDEYRNTVNGFTGLRFDATPHEGTDVTLFYVLPQERLPDTQAEIVDNKVVWDRETFDDVLFGANVAIKKAIAGGEVDLAYYRLAESDTPGRATADRHLHTFDVRFARDAKAGKPDWDVEGAYQFGRDAPSTSATAVVSPVSSGFAHGALGYTWDIPLKPRLGVFYDYASGRFDTLFGSRRDDLGPSGTYAVLARQNISAPGVRLEAKPGTRFELLADYRLVWLASRTDAFDSITDATGHSGSYAGSQFEGRLRYWLVPKHLRLESNFAVFDKGDFLRTAPTALAKGDNEVRLIETNLQVTF